MKSVPSFSLRIWRSLCKALSSSTLPKENPRVKGQSQGRAPQVSHAHCHRTPELLYLHNLAGTWALRFSPRGQRQHGLSAFCSRFAEKTITPFLHAASLKIKTAWPKEKAALVSGGCESSGFCLMHLFQDCRNSRQTCRALRLCHLSLEMSSPF